MVTRPHLPPLGLLITKLVVEAPSDISRQLQMLPLILSHGHKLRLVQQNIRSHQYGVVEKTHPHVFPLLDRLLFELNHPLQPVHGRHAVKKPGEFRVGQDVGLYKDSAFGRIDSSGQVQGSGFDGLLPEALGVVWGLGHEGNKRGKERLRFGTERD